MQRQATGTGWAKSTSMAQAGQGSSRPEAERNGAARNHRDQEVSSQGTSRAPEQSGRQHRHAAPTKRRPGRASRAHKALEGGQPEHQQSGRASGETPQAWRPDRARAGRAPLSSGGGGRRHSHGRSTAMAQAEPRRSRGKGAATGWARRSHGTGGPEPKQSAGAAQAEKTMRGARAKGPLGRQKRSRCRMCSRHVGPQSLPVA